MRPRTLGAFHLLEEIGLHGFQVLARKLAPRHRFTDRSFVAMKQRQFGAQPDLIVVQSFIELVLAHAALVPGVARHQVKLGPAAREFCAHRVVGNVVFMQRAHQVGPADERLRAPLIGERGRERIDVGPSVPLQRRLLQRGCRHAHRGGQTRSRIDAARTRPFQPLLRGGELERCRRHLAEADLAGSRAHLGRRQLTLPVVQQLLQEIDLIVGVNRIEQRLVYLRSHRPDRLGHV